MAETIDLELTASASERTVVFSVAPSTFAAL
jgi:hypothetical protein